MGTNTEPTCPDCGKEFDVDEPVCQRFVCDDCGCKFEADPSFTVDWTMYRLKECDECGRLKAGCGSLCAICLEEGK